MNLYVGTAEHPTTGQQISTLIHATSMEDAEQQMSQYHPGGWLFLYPLNDWRTQK